VSLLASEGGDIGHIKAVLDRLKRNKDGRVFLRKEDEKLWEMIEGQLKKRSAQKKAAETVPGWSGRGDGRS
jgi:hypothetical protein